MILLTCFKSLCTRLRCTKLFSIIIMICTSINQTELHRSQNNRSEYCDLICTRTHPINAQVTNAKDSKRYHHDVTMSKDAWSLVVKDTALHHHPSLCQVFAGLLTAWYVKLSRQPSN